MIDRERRAEPPQPESALQSELLAADRLSASDITPPSVADDGLAHITHVLVLSPVQERWASGSSTLTQDDLQSDDAAPPPPPRLRSVLITWYIAVQMHMGVVECVYVCVDRSDAFAAVSLGGRGVEAGGRSL